VSESAIVRALARLSGLQAVLAPDRDGVGFAVYVSGDRRRRPAAKLSTAQVKQLASDGAIASQGDRGTFVLTQAGRARLQRAAAAKDEAFLAQHGAMEDRAVMEAGGAQQMRRAVGSAGLKRLTALRDAAGAPWLAPDEIAAALRLRADWEAGQAGMVSGSDWTAPPRGAVARGPSNAQEVAVNAACDARSRVAAALARLAPPLRRVVERACLAEEGIESLERSEGWPARSGKIALKLGLAQLAAHGA